MKASLEPHLFFCLAYLLITWQMGANAHQIELLAQLPGFSEAKDVVLQGTRALVADAGYGTFQHAPGLFAVDVFDPDHSKDENRFILLGMSFKLRALVVCHCFLEGDLVVRIISARKADKSEESEYWRRRL